MSGCAKVIGSCPVRDIRIAVYIDVDILPVAACVGMMDYFFHQVTGCEQSHTPWNSKLTISYITTKRKSNIYVSMLSIND